MSTKKCKNCQKNLTANAKYCPNCGTDNTSPDKEHAYVLKPEGQKSRIVAGLLGIFLGSWGIHNFYLGYTQRGLTQLLISLIGGFFTCGIASFFIGIWGLVEGILILTESPGYAKDAEGRPLGD